MKEFVTANGVIYECKKVETRTDSIEMTIEGRTVSELISEFENVTDLTVSFGENKEDLNGNFSPVLEEPHGFYKNLKLEHVGTNVQDGTTLVIMHIKSEIERRLDALEAGQELQNGAIDELANVVGQ